MRKRYGASRMATAAAVSASCVNDTWIVTSFRCLAISPVNRTRGRPHISVTTSMSRWMSSRNTGRWENRDPDQALITASLAAHRAARWRAADELLSEASRRSPGVKVSAKTVPGWSTCSANSVMETRSIPTPTMLIGRNLSDVHRGWSKAVQVVVAQSRVRVEQHRRFLPLLGPLVVEATVGGPLVQLAATRDRRCQSPLSGQQAGVCPAQVIRTLLGIQRGHEGLRVHQRDQTGHVAEPEAGHQPGLQRELLAEPQRVAHPDEVRGVREFVVDAIQAAVWRDHPVAQDLAQAHHLEDRRAAQIGRASCRERV